MPTRDDFTELLAEIRLADAPKPACHEFSRILWNEFRLRSASAPEAIATEACRILWLATTYMLSWASHSDPFSDASLAAHSLQAVPEEARDALRELAPLAEPEDLRARLADITWTWSRDPELAVVAIRAYLGTARTLFDLKEWIDSYYRLKRAYGISIRLGRTHELHIEVQSRINTILDEHCGRTDSFLVAKLLLLAAEYVPEGIRRRLITCAEASIRIAIEAGNWNQAEAMAQGAIAHANKLQDMPLVHRLRASLAEVSIVRSEAALSGSQPSRLLAAVWLEKATRMLQELPDQTERLRALQLKLREHQAASLNELQSFKTELDVSAFAKQAIDSVTVPTLSEALRRFALVGSSLDYGALRQEAERNASMFVFSHLLAKTRIDFAGRTVARIPSPFDGGEAAEVALWAATLEQADLSHKLVVAGQVLPALNRIKEQFEIGIEDIQGCIEESWFIPPQHLGQYLLGLHAGFRGEFVLSTHVLLPQIEGSIRHVLQLNGIPTDRLDAYGAQEPRPLRWHFSTNKEALTRILGDDLRQDLQGLLVDKVGANLRDTVMHGVVPDFAFYSHQVVYLWWLAFRLCVLPTLRAPDGPSTGVNRPGSLEAPSVESDSPSSAGSPPGGSLGS